MEGASRRRVGLRRSERGAPRRAHDEPDRVIPARRSTCATGRSSRTTPILTFAAGMLRYGAVNLLGWALHNDVTLAIPMGIAVVSAGWLMVVVGARG